VELEDIYAEGLVHVTSLSNDYYHFDPVNHRLVGERTRKTYRLSDRVQVRVARVDLDEKKIDFELIKDYGGAAAGIALEEPAGPRGKKKKRKGLRKKTATAKGKKTKKKFRAERAERVKGTGKKAKKAKKAKKKKGTKRKAKKQAR
jgi:ribonuclease R